MQRESKREGERLPPALKTDSGILSFQDTPGILIRPRGQESKSIIPQDRLSVQDQISLKNSAAERKNKRGAEVERREGGERWRERAAVREKSGRYTNEADE